MQKVFVDAAVSRILTILHSIDLTREYGEVIIRISLLNTLAHFNETVMNHHLMVKQSSKHFFHTPHASTEERDECT